MFVENLDIISQARYRELSSYAATNHVAGYVLGAVLLVAFCYIHAHVQL